MRRHDFFDNDRLDFSFRQIPFILLPPPRIRVCLRLYLPWFCNIRPTIHQPNTQPSIRAYLFGSNGVPAYAFSIKHNVFPYSTNPSIHPFIKPFIRAYICGPFMAPMPAPIASRKSFTSNPASHLCFNRSVMKHSVLTHLCEFAKHRPNGMLKTIRRPINY